MRDVPEWLKEALKSRFDEQSHESQQNSTLNSLREHANRLFKQFRHKISVEVDDDFLHWEETCQYLHAQELEFLYMQGVKDGAQILFGLLFCPHQGNGLSVLAATCGNEESGG